MPLFPAKFPQLTSPRLILRQVTEADLPAIQFLRSDPVVNQFVQRSQARTQEEALAFLHKINSGIKKEEILYWGICLKENGAMIGSICLWNFSEDRRTAEVGYDLMPSCQRLGIMDEALKTVLHYGFETLDLAEVVAYTQHNNEPSTKLLERNQFLQLPDRTDAHNPLNVIYQLKR